MFEAKCHWIAKLAFFGEWRGEISHKSEVIEKDNVRKEEMMMNTINLS